MDGRHRWRHATVIAGARSSASPDAGLSPDHTLPADGDHPADTDLLDGLRPDPLARWAAAAVGARWPAALLGAPLTRRVVQRCRPGDEPPWLERAARLQRLMQRLLVHRGVDLCLGLERDGMPCMLIKGPAVAERHWPCPELRAFDDVDLLIRPGDLPRAVVWLADHGYRALEATRPRSMLGRLTERLARRVLVSEGGCGLLPPQGDVALDLHAYVERNPVPRTLDTDDLMAAGSWQDTSAGRVRVPAPEHAFAIAVLHAHRSYYGGDQAKTVLDGIMIARTHPDALADRLPPLAERGGFWRRSLVLVQLMRRLWRDDPLPALPHWPTRGAAAGVLDEATARLTLRHPEPPPPLAKLCQHWALADSWAEYGHRHLVRLADLSRPWNRVPPGLETSPRPGAW